MKPAFPGDDDKNVAANPFATPAKGNKKADAGKKAANPFATPAKGNKKADAGKKAANPFAPAAEAGKNGLKKSANPFEN